MSLWFEECNLKSFSALEEDLACDVCIIGAGITGLTTAYYLAKKGFSVIIVEKDTIASKTTGNTTGKITSQHGLFYDYLLKTYGYDFAKDYYYSNEAAIINIKKIIDENKINCDFEVKNNYVFTESFDYIQKFKNEYKALCAIGISPIYNEKLALPFNVTTSIGFSNQAQFNVIKYIKGLICFLENNNIQIFENTKIINVKEDSSFCTVYAKNSKITCKYVVMATRYPFINFPGFHFLKMYQSTSYAMAIDANIATLNDMYISFEEPTISIRTATYNGKTIPIIAGNTHKTGKPLNNPYAFLENIAKKFSKNYNVISKWNTEDSISVDKLPYIGKFSTFMPHVYIATGFKKWGMTTSNIAANIICDSICDIKNKYSYLFNSERFHPIKNAGEVKNMLLEVADSLVIDKFKTKEFNISDLENDSAKTFKINGNLVGSYRDPNGKLHSVKPICSHLGCNLKWNNALKTWDCPCHGSRFDYDGNCIYGPSVGNLKKYDL